MAQINFQFHARRNELLTFISEMANEHNLYVVSVELFPNFKYRIETEINDLIFNQDARLIVLSVNYPILDLTDYNDFCKTIRGNFTIFLGMDSNNIIQNSSMGCLSDTEVDKLWVKINNKYKRKMLKGAWGINPLNGGKFYYKNHYYTEQAKMAYENDYKLHSSVGNTVFALD